MGALAILFSITAGICAAQSPIEYNVPTTGGGATNTSGPNGIAVGPDGNLWFTEAIENKIGTITTYGTITEYIIPTSGSVPMGIVAGPDGNLWFTENQGNKIGSITTSGAVTEYVIPTGGSAPAWIAAGPDGNLWFTENQGNRVGKITTGGAIAEYVIPTGSSGPADIAKGPDGNLWFTENQGNQIGKITTGGTVTEYAIPTGGSQPLGIAAGPDGNLWFTENQGNQIGKIAIGGTVTEYAIPTSTSGPSGIATGPDGNLWFTELTKIGRITSRGTVTEYVLASGGGGPGGIVAGPDMNLWFTEYNGNKIAIDYPFGQVFPHLAMGPLGSDVWTTQIILDNITDNPAVFTMNFVQDNGQPASLGSFNISDETQKTGIIQAQNGESVFGLILGRGTVSAVLSSGTFVEAWATLGGLGITGEAVLHRHTSDGADYEAIVPLSMGGTRYRVPFNATSYYNGTTQFTSIPYITGIALVNQDPSSTATISCAILDPNGSSLGSATPITLPPMGHTALQLNAAAGFGSVSGNIGSLDCSSSGSLFAVFGLRFLGGNDLTSFPPIKLR